MSVWSGRSDGPEGASGRRWHEVVRPLSRAARGGAAIVGFACDAGVRRNGGRAGAGNGPCAMRAMLANMPAWPGLSDDYLDACIAEMLPAVVEAGLADAVDAFCEGIAFSPRQVERLFRAAARHGLPVKLHAEQLSSLGGAELVARHRGLSADHVEYLTPAGVAAMAQAGTVAVLLPGAFYFLRETRVPPIDELRRAGVAMAVATDCNPGTSPMTSVLQAMNMACVLFRLTPGEALAGATINAARALGLADRIGSIEPGKVADLALWPISRPAELAYAISGTTPEAIVFGGRLVHCPVQS